MKNKDDKILTSSALAIMDGIVSALDNSLNNGAPLFAVSWGLSKGLYGANIQLRQQRALEFVEMIRDNPEIFTKELLQTEDFQDGFVFTFQKYLSERIEEKRQVIKKIFFGFSEADNKRDFKLERFLYTIEQLSVEDIKVFKIFSDGTINEWLKIQFPEMKPEDIVSRSKEPLNVLQIGTHILSGIKGMNQFKDNDYTAEILARLSGLGLIIGNIKTTWDYTESYFKGSGFGGEFVSYLVR